MPEKASIVEVGPRDGFQMESRFIPTELKVAVIDQISTSGIGKIEATSFVHPRIIPQMADAERVMQQITRRPNVIYSCLIPNLRGAERALRARVDAVRMVVCMTESYNQRNAGMSVAESGRMCQEVLRVAQAGGVHAEAVIGLAFGCVLEGEVPEERVVSFIRFLVESGYREISLADSVGLANPAQIRRICRRVLREFPDAHFSLHLHNTRGLGLANVLAALEEGIDTFDSSIGGLGGCPMVPGGSGNIATEDLVNMLHEMGVKTGVDLDKLTTASRLMSDFLQRPLLSYVLSSGTRQQVFARVADQNRAGKTAS